MLDVVVRRSLSSSPLPATRGIHTAPGIGLGAVADLDESAPAAGVAITREGTIRTVADARIANAGELRARLGREGHAFRDHSDAELIAHAYEHWGMRCVERLRGPFAFALWDDQMRRLVIARDHLGLRPLYFAVLHGHGVVFATELQALFCDPG